MMPTRLELQDLALLRLEEARSLFVANKYDGCVYLCGYVLEMALKAVICKHLAISAYPELAAFKVHNFNTLKLFAGLENESGSLMGVRRAHWMLLTTWESTLRYMPRNSYNRAKAEAWLNALEDPSDGVLLWLQTKW